MHAPYVLTAVEFVIGLNSIEDGERAEPNVAERLISPCRNARIAVLLTSSDILKEPMCALAEVILGTPMVVKVAPVARLQMIAHNETDAFTKDAFQSWVKKVRTTIPHS